MKTYLLHDYHGSSKIKAFMDATFKRMPPSANSYVYQIWEYTGTLDNLAEILGPKMITFYLVPQTNIIFFTPQSTFGSR